MKFTKYTFWIAAIYGVLIIFPLFFSEQKLGIDYPPPISHAEYFYSFAAVTLIWQVLFIFIAVNPIQLRPVIIPCILEKLCLLPAFVIMVPQGRFPYFWIPLMLVDIIFAIAFFIAFRKLKGINSERGTAFPGAPAKR
jgi:hypothetical protein